MNKRLSLTILIVLFVMFSIGAVSANDVNVADVGAVSLADDTSDASVSLEETADSPEISESDVSDVEEDFTLSISDKEALESDSNDLSTNSAGNVTINDILAASNDFKTYYNEKGVLPDTIDVGNDTFTIHEFYYLMNKALSQLNKSNNDSIEPIMGVEAPSSKCIDTVYSAALMDYEFMGLADEAIEYIAENKQIKDHVVTIAGKIAYEDYITLIARALAFMYNNEVLPNYVTFFSDDPSKVNYTEEGELNPFGLYGKKVWIDADEGSDEMKWKIANALDDLGWDVYVGSTGPNTHYEDWLNAHPGYVLINIYNGFCAGTMKHQIQEENQNVLKTKHVVCVPVWDTSLWMNTEGMAKYRYGDFVGYSAKRAWDDNFSDIDPSIKEVDQFFKFYDIPYCAAPTCELIVAQFLKGGYYGAMDNTTVSIADVVEAAAVLKDSISFGTTPDKISVGGTYYSTPQFLFMMAEVAGLIGSGKNSSRIIPVEASVSPTFDNNATGQLEESQYIDIAFELVGYISSNNTAPGSVNSSLGRIGYPELVDAFSTILAYYKSNSKLPNQVLIKPITHLVAKYENGTIFVAVSDDNGNPVKGIKVGFSLPNGVKYDFTDEDGQVKYSTSGFDEGNYNVKVRCYGNDTYADSNKETVKFTISKIATKLGVTSLSTTPKGGKYILAVLTDADGKAIAGARIGFATPNGTKFINTDANGKARLSVDDFAEGSYNVKVAYYGNDTYRASDKATSKVVISKIATKLGVTSVSTTPNGGKYILAVLTDADGKAIAGARIGFATPNGMKYVVTDANGKARLSVDDFAEGNYNVKVAYFGNDTYRASDKATSKVSISKIATNLGVTSLSAKYKSNKYVIAVLTDATGKVISNAKIGFATPNGVKYANTDANGKARLYISDLAVGTYSIKVAYYGNDTYKASEKVTSKVTITK